MKLKKLQQFLEKSPTDVLGVDATSKEIRLVRLRRQASGPSLAGHQVLEVPFSTDEDAAVEALALPPEYKARYAALCTPHPDTRIKILRAPDLDTVRSDDKLPARLGCVSGTEMRSGVLELTPPSGKEDGYYLAVAQPESACRRLLSLLPASGKPAPRGLGASQLAVLSAFTGDAHTGADAHPLGFIHFDHDFSLIAMLHEGVPTQLRIFPFSVSTVLRKVTQALNVDATTAEGILRDGAFDMSHLVRDGTQEMRSQLVISRDYLERTQNVTVDTFFVSGPAGISDPFKAAMNPHEKLVDWNPLDAYLAAGDDADDAEPAGLESDTWSYGAALGAALEVLNRS